MHSTFSVHELAAGAARLGFECLALTDHNTIPLDAAGAAAPPRWVRAELWGVAESLRSLIAFTNAIYFSGEEAE